MLWHDLFDWILKVHDSGDLKKKYATFYLCDRHAFKITSTLISAYHH